MLTPAQIRAHEFQSAGRGTYRSIDVDEFMGEIAEASEALDREKNEYIRRINALAEKVESYQKEEGNISAALLTAQKMAATMTAESTEKAEALINDATEKANATVAEAEEKSAAMMNEAEEKSTAMLAEA